MLSPLLLILYLIPPIFLFLFFQNQRSHKTLSFPPGPKGLPIIGNLHQLDNSTIHIQLCELSKKYGPMFSLKLGLRNAVVVCSSKLAKEFLKSHDHVFCGRPKLLGQQKMSYGGLDISFSPCSDYWREVRKISVIHVLSSRRVSIFSSIRHFEVKEMIKKISRNASKLTNLNEAITSLTSTIICRSAFGRRYDEDHEGFERSRFHGMHNDIQDMFVSFFVSDYIPFLGWIDRLNGLHARLNKTFKEFDEFFEEVINEHMNPNRKTQGGEDIIDVLLQLKKERSFSVYLTHDHIKAILMNILVGATDTTAATIVWTMTALIKHPRVLKKVQEEIRNLGCKKDFLYEHDIQNFTYLKAVIKEIFRLYPPAPLLLPRESKENCVIGGYKIPAKTLVYINAWAIHRDHETWKDPNDFNPERFLDEFLDFGGQDFELIPFGSGRRMCPGIHMAIASIDLILANLLYSFDWELPLGVKKEDIDMQVLPGLVPQKKNPLCLFAKCYM